MVAPDGRVREAQSTSACFHALSGGGGLVDKLLSTPRCCYENTMRAAGHIAPGF